MFGKKEIKPPVFHITTDFVIEHVFDYAGEAYFRVKDPFKLPAGKTFAVKRYYDQLKSSCSIDYLKGFHNALKNILSNPATIDVTKIHDLNKNLGERLEWLYTDDDVLRFASVIYFTNEESPYKYDQAYNNKKIEKWKAAGELYAFFLSEPIVTLMPFFGQLGDFTPIYSDVVNKAQQIHISALLSMLSTEQKSDSYAQNLLLYLEESQSRNNYNEEESLNTSQSSKPDIKTLNQRNLNKYKKGSDEKKP